MKVLIIEDERAAARNLALLLEEIDPNIEVCAIIDTISKAVDFFKKPNDIDLAFFDIHLADGNSFEIFEQTEVSVPIIFTTAYDEYAIKAFKVNSVDYLLKPIDEEELKEAIAKFRKTKKEDFSAKQFKNLVENLDLSRKQYKKTYLVQQADTLTPIETGNIAYFIIDTGVVKAVSFENQKYVIDKKLEEIESELDPYQFFRANRQIIVQRKAIENIKIYFNGKLILNVRPETEDKLIISKAKASSFKSWIN